MTFDQAILILFYLFAGILILCVAVGMIIAVRVLLLIWKVIEKIKDQS